MNSLLIAGDHGTPITLVETSSYDTWFEQQPESLQNWLASTEYKGKGVSLVPGEDGVLQQVILGVNNIDSHFICGDLPTTLPAGDYRLEGDEAQQQLAAFSWGLGAYRFDRYKKADDKERPQLVLPAQQLVDEADRLVQAVALVRDMVNTPAGDMMPQHMAEVVENLGHEFGADVRQIVGDDLLAEDYPTIHAVGRASVHAPRLIDLRWGDESHPKVTLVGKGVCFDSGGLDLKPAAGMRLMKKDMGGAAHVAGLARLIMSHNLPVRLRMLIPAVENAVAGNAFRPGDVITTRQGLTVEVDNTDAEGRLVLCDALTEACTESPELIVDFATLTGACRVALGTELPGFFTDDSSLAAELLTGGEQTDDPVWQLPLHKPYKQMLKSDIADLVNCASGPFGGAITAALYLQEFVKSDIPWVHFDIMAWNTRKQPGRPAGGEAFGVRAVFEVLKQRYQK
ncbi:MAG: leucyl aminopeptidase family protein [Porticoccaceae bacterium]|nr:leucyl aminopeptidase family protein [Porticoccaceae bacterium]